MSSRRTIPGSRGACRFASPHSHRGGCFRALARSPVCKRPALWSLLWLKKPAGQFSWSAGPLSRILFPIVSQVLRFTRVALVQRTLQHGLHSVTVQEVSRCSGLWGCTRPEPLATIFGSRCSHHCKPLSPKCCGGKGWQCSSLQQAARPDVVGQKLVQFRPKGLSTPSLLPLVPFPNNVPSFENDCASIVDTSSKRNPASTPTVCFITASYEALILLSSLSFGAEHQASQYLITTSRPLPSKPSKLGGHLK